MANALLKVNIAFRVLLDLPDLFIYEIAVLWLL